MESENNTVPRQKTLEKRLKELLKLELSPDRYDHLVGVDVEAMAEYLGCVGDKSDSRLSARKDLDFALAFNKVRDQLRDEENIILENFRNEENGFRSGYYRKVVEGKRLLQKVDQRIRKTDNSRRRMFETARVASAESEPKIKSAVERRLQAEESKTIAMKVATLNRSEKFVYNTDKRASFEPRALPKGSED